MDTTASSKFLFIFLLSYTFMLCSSGSFLSRRVQYGRRELMQSTQDDTMNPPFPASPVTNPVTTPTTNPVTTPATGTYPPDGLTPPLVTVPSANSGPIPPATDPTINPVPIPPATDPTTNPAGPLPPATNPTTNPAGPLPPATNPTTNPPFPGTGGGVPAVGPPAAGGQSWCVARSGAAETVIQVALDYACGMGGADCSGIQQGGACYNPNTLQNHASYAFNSYYQKNPMPTSCDFGGAAMLTNVNPSSGSCVFPSSSSSSASPATMSPTTTGTPPMMPTPDTDFSSGAGVGTPPALMNASNPALGGGIAGYGETPTASISSASATSAAAAGLIACITLSLSVILHERL